MDSNNCSKNLVAVHALPRSMLFSQTRHPIPCNKNEPTLIWAQGFMQDSPFVTSKIKYVRKKRKDTSEFYTDYASHFHHPHYGLFHFTAAEKHSIILY